VPEGLRSLEEAEPYAVDVAPSLRALASELDTQN
jgi:hypothetical protein